MYYGKSISDFYVNAKFDNGNGRLKIHHPEFDANISAAISDSTLSGDYIIDVTNIKPLAEILDIDDVDGKLNISGTLGGTYQSPAIEAVCDAAAPAPARVRPARYRITIRPCSTHRRAAASQRRPSPGRNPST